MKKLQSIGLFLLLTLSVAANAANRYVPTSQYPTIQAAINACSNGDTVIVADGTYTGAGNRDIDFRRIRVFIGLTPEIYTDRFASID